MAWFKWISTRIANARAYSPPQRALLIRAYLLLPLVAISLRVLGFKRTQSTLQKPLRQRPILPIEAPPVDSTQSNSAAQALLMSRLVRTAARYHVFRFQCLTQSLVLWRLLLDQGLSCELHFGVRRNEENLEAHAWIVHEGTVLDDGLSRSQPFEPFDRPIVGSQHRSRQ